MLIAVGRALHSLFLLVRAEGVLLKRDSRVESLVNEAEFREIPCAVCGATIRVYARLLTDGAIYITVLHVDAGKPIIDELFFKEVECVCASKNVGGVVARV